MRDKKRTENIEEAAKSRECPYDDGEVRVMLIEKQNAQ